MSHWDNAQKDPRMEMILNNMRRVTNQRDKYKQALRDIKKHMELNALDIVQCSPVFHMVNKALEE